MEQQRNNQVGKYIEEVISIKWLVVGVIFYFYGDLLKRKIMHNAQVNGVSINGWDITLQLMNDMYLIVYFVIPLVLYLSINSILSDFDYQNLIRLGTFKRWVYRSLKLFWKRSSPLLFLWAFVSLFMMIGLPHSWSWSQLSKSKLAFNALYELTDFFLTPVSGFGFQLFSLFITLSFLHIGLAILYVLTQNKNFILVICAFFFLGGMAGFKLLPKELAFLSPTTYFSLTKAVNSFNTPILSSIFIIVFGVMCLLLLHILDFNKRRILHTIKPFLPVGIYFILCLLGILSTASSLNSAEATIWDLWVMSFRGSSSEDFAYFPFFFYSIVFFGFIYLVNLFLNEEIESIGYYKIIRFRNINKWFWNWFKKLIIIVVFFILTLTGLTLFIAVCMGMKTNFTLTTVPVPLIEVIYHFGINSFLQIILYIFAVFIVSWKTKEPSYVLILISLFMIVMLPGINAAGIIPVGLNSFSYLNEHSLLYLTSILIFMNILVYAVINYLFKRSLKI